MHASVRSRRSSTALWIVFFVNGAVLASWAPRIPQVKSELSLSDGQMGWALLGIAVGSVPSLAGTARLLRSVSARSVCITASTAFAAALPLIGLSPNGWALGIVLAVLGAASGCLDVAMNTAAIEYQNCSGTKILARLHGGYSLGVLVGAGFGAFASKFGVSVFAHFIGVGLFLLVLVIAASPSLPLSISRRQVRADSCRPTANGWSVRVLAIPASIGVMAVAALLLEGMVTDWSALLVSRDYS